MQLQPSDALPKIMLARYCSSTLGRFLSVDPVGATPTNPQTWHKYAYTHNNPVVRVDRDGRNWFQINGEWEWHKGDTHTYTDDDGNEQTVESDYTHLVVFEKTGTNAEGAETGTLTVYDQDKAVLTATAFSGGGGSDAIPDGTFMIRLDIRGKADGPDALKANQQELKQFYGIQEIAPTITDANGVARDARWEWGSRRAALNEPAGETRAGYLGNYLHGKNRPGDYTQGCVCDRSGAALGYLSTLDPRAVPKVPVEVK
jgi:RHS repeat-associated protein